MNTYIYIYSTLEPPDNQRPVWEFRVPVLDAVLLERPLRVLEIFARKAELLLIRVSHTSTQSQSHANAQEECQDTFFAHHSTEHMSSAPETR